MSEPKSSNRTLILGLSVVIIAVIGLGLYLYSTNLALTSELNTLKGQYNTLTNQYNSLSSQYNSLTSQFNNLSNQFDDLENDYDSLLINYNQLNTAYSSLSTNYSQLIQEYNELLTRVPPDEGISIEWVNDTHLQVHGVTVRNLGVNSVSVYSLKLWRDINGILADSVVVPDVEIPGNTSVYISAFISVHGYNSESETWTVEVLTREWYNATSDPLQLWYAT